MQKQMNSVIMPNPTMLMLFIKESKLVMHVVLLCIEVNTQVLAIFYEAMYV